MTPLSARSDSELVAQFLAMHAEEAFTELVQRHTRLVYGVCLRVLADSDRAQDATQATFLVLFRKLSELRPGTPLSGWLFRVAEQTARNMRKSQLRLEHREREAGMMAQRRAPEEKQEHLLPELDGALASLPEQQRHTIVLRYLQGLTRSEIANVLKCPEATVHTRLSRALDALRDRLSKRGVTISAALLSSSLAAQLAPSAPAALPATVAAACLGKTAVSAGVSAAADVTVRSMLLAKVKLWAAVVLLTGLASGSVAVVAHHTAVAVPVVYYVDGQSRSASDSNGGNSADAPWQTISRAVRALKPGDTLQIKAGEYRETVSFTASGTAAQPITVQAYPGDEGKVLIKGSDIVTNWQPESGAQWSTPWTHKLDVAYPDKWPQPGGDYPFDFKYIWRGEMVFCDGEPLQQVTQRTRLERGTFWVDDSQGRIVVLLRDSSAPGTHRMELAVRQQGIHAYTCRYLNVRGLTVTQVANGYQTGAFSVSGDNNVLIGNTATFNNLAGFTLSGKTLKLTGNQAHNNGGIGMVVSASSSILENNSTNENCWRFGPGWTAAGLRIMIGRENIVRAHTASGNNGAGIIFNTGCQNSRIEACRIDNNVVCGLGLTSCESGIVATRNIITHTRSWPAFKRPYATGVGVQLAATVGPSLYNNTIAANENVGILIEGKLSSNAPYADTWPADSRIINNIIADNGVGGVLFWVWDGYEDPARLRTHVFDHNLWHQPGSYIAAYPNKNPFDLKSYTMRKTLAEWQGAFNQDQHSLEADPQFAAPKALDFTLQPGSPALNKAVNVEGGTSTGATDLGAVQRSSSR